MDEHIFDPVTYALLKSQLKTDNIQNDSKYVTGEDLTEALNSLYNAINDINSKLLNKNYLPGEYIMFEGAEIGLSAADNLINVIIHTERTIPLDITITPNLTILWVRYDGITDNNVELVSAIRNTADSFKITVRVTNGISSGYVCGVFLRGSLALS